MTSRYVSNNTTKSLRETTTRAKIWMKPTDQMDLWLDSQGYYRKHTAKDGSCLYRAVSEQVFLAQAFHLDVRRHCAEYAQRHPELLTSVTHCSLKEFVEQMKHPHEAGGKVEIEILSLMYRKDFLVFHEVGKTFERVTSNGFQDQIMLCLSQDRHYDSVYTKQFISNAAFCQSLTYEMLYKGVFELLEVDYAIKKMLHDKTSKYQRDPSSFFMNGLALRLEIRDSYVNVKDLLTLGVTPFPYKVAKSLDPDIYRNVEYDTWNDIRRGLRYGLYTWNNRELQVGVKCLIKLQPDQVFHAHIQEMTPNKGPVLVFIEELGEKKTVPYENLELLPQPPTPQPLSLPLKQLKQLQTLKELQAVLTQDVDQREILDNINSRDTPPTRCHDKDFCKREPETDDRITPKFKIFPESSKSCKKTNKCFRTKSKELQQPSNYEMIKNHNEDESIVSSSECTYHQQDITNYQPESFEDYPSPGYNYQENIEPNIGEDMLETKGPHSQLCGTPPMLCVEPQHYYVPNTEGMSHPTYCYLPHKPVLPDGSELPVTDLSQLRFFYNYGADHFPRSVRPTPPCYLNTTLAYVPEPNGNLIYDQASPISTPDSAVVVSPVGVFTQPQRPDSLPVLSSPGGVSHASEPDSTTHNQYSGHHIAPRFKNKVKTTTQGRAQESPLVQQPEISSTTSITMPTHYIPPPVYYHPLECEAYCPASFVEYSVYDPPTVVYSQLHSIPPPTHFFHPDALFYPHVIAAPLPPAL